jgi:hypothetical protein
MSIAVRSKDRGRWETWPFWARAKVEMKMEMATERTKTLRLDIRDSVLGHCKISKIKNSTAETPKKQRAA